MVPVGLLNLSLRRVGQPVWLYPSEGTHTRTRGVFQEEEVVAEALQGTTVRRKQPAIVVPTEDAAGMTRGDRVITNETEYRAEDVDRLRQGTRITLRAA